MKATFQAPDFDLDDRTTIYRVRIWTPPMDPVFAWALDDWELEAVRSVTEVLEWARTEAGSRSFEVLARTSASTSWIRLHGEPADHSERRVQVPLSFDP